MGKHTEDAKMYIDDALTSIENCRFWDALEELRNAETEVLEHLKLETGE